MQSMLLVSFNAGQQISPADFKHSYAVGDPDSSTSHDMEVVSSCGFIELQVNFLATQIYIADSYKIQNLTLMDNMEEANGMVLVVDGKGSNDPLVLKSPFCSRELFLEICTVEEFEELTLTVVQQQSICYLAPDSTPTGVQKLNDTLFCTMQNYVQCRKNELV